MKSENLICSLAEEELQSIYGGNIFNDIVSWFKKHFFHEKVDEHSWESICTPGYDGTDMYGVAFDI